MSKYPRIKCPRATAFQRCSVAKVCVGMHTTYLANLDTTVEKLPTTYLHDVYNM